MIIKIDNSLELDTKIITHIEYISRFIISNKENGGHGIRIYFNDINYCNTNDRLLSVDILSYDKSDTFSMIITSRRGMYYKSALSFHTVPTNMIEIWNELMAFIEDSLCITIADFSNNNLDYIK